MNSCCRQKSRSRLNGFDPNYDGDFMQTEPQNINALKAKLLSYDPKADIEIVQKAYDFAAQAHEGQKRNSGEPYITHPLSVAFILTDIEMDADTLAAALLHDVVEDTGVSEEQLQNRFGQEITQLVDGVTKLNRINFNSRREAQAENLRKMLLAMAKDIRVIIIKLADRLHNMRTLNFQLPERQQDISSETLEIFAPLAHRIGVFRFKWELEDIAFSYLDPETFNAIAKRLRKKRREQEEYVQALIEQISIALTENDIRGDIAGRPKNIYSIYRKMLKQNKNIDEIYDKIAIRVIVDDIKSCYEVLGVIHTIWKPLPGRFKDYISMPKPNMYQSLHTTLIGDKGEPFEVQIRTWEMHRTSEYGLAAHWRYKEGGISKDRNFDEKLAWLRSILDWQQDVKDTDEFMESLKIDLFEDTVFVFTPQGDVIELPKGSCPIDFAYRVHTEVGHRLNGAKVNGRIVPIDYKLNNGDIVTILTAKNSNGPSPDWLNIAKTSSAKSRIRRWFKKEMRAEKLIKGHDMLEQALKKKHLDPRALMRSDYLLQAGAQFNIETVDEIYLSIAEGAITPMQWVNKIKDTFFPDTRLEEIIPSELSKSPITRDSSSSALKIEGIDDVAIRLAHCCNPLPGDAVSGYITRGRGISVHRDNCSNIQNLIKTEPDRIIPVEWTNDKGSYMVELEILASDRPRLTADVMDIISDVKANLLSVYSRQVRKTSAIINMKLEIRNIDHLSAIMQRISKTKDVLEIKRVVPGDNRSEL